MRTSETKPHFKLPYKQGLYAFRAVNLYQYDETPLINRYRYEYDRTSKRRELCHPPPARKTKMQTFIVVTHDPHKTPHFDRVASVLFTGSYVDCEAVQGSGYITIPENAPTANATTTIHGIASNCEETPLHSHKGLGGYNAAIVWVKALASITRHSKAPLRGYEYIEIRVNGVTKATLEDGGFWEYYNGGRA
jgi:hypothetical protein